MTNIQTSAQDIVDLYAIVEREYPHLLKDLDQLLIDVHLDFLNIIAVDKLVPDENQSGL